MSFSIEPKAGPSIQQPPGAQSSEQVSARDKAIQRLLSNSAHTLPVSEPSKVAPEEAQSLKTQTESRQIDTNEGTTQSQAPKEEPKAAVSEKPLSPEYAILARKEQQIRAREQQLRAREAAIKAAEDAKNAPAKPVFDESQYISKDKLQKDLFGTLSELGLSYDQITQQAINAPTPEQVAFQQEIRSLKEELKALRGETENTKKTWEQQQQDSYKQAVNQIRNEASALINHNPNFETIKETNSLGDVVELIERTFNEDGTLLTVEEAAQQVEDYLVDEALKIARIKKIQQKLAPASSPTPTPAPQSNSQPKQQQMTTLTNKTSATRQLSARERAILAAEGKLNR